jgi:hypothetical protein
MLAASVSNEQALLRECGVRLHYGRSVMYGPMRSPGLMFGISQNQIKSFLAKSLGLNNIIISASSTEGALAKFDVPVRSVSADISVSWNGSPALFWANWLLAFSPVLLAHDWRTQDAKLVRTLLELHVTLPASNDFILKFVGF